MIIIQQKLNYINIVDTKQQEGKQIVFSALISSISKSQRNGNKIQLVSENGILLYEFVYSGIRTQDYLGAIELWHGTVDEFLDKLNSEYFTSSSSFPLPIGAATSNNQQTEIDRLTDIVNDGATKAQQQIGNQTLVDLLAELVLKAKLTDTQPISAASLPLPTGASTAAIQATMLAAIQALTKPTDSQYSSSRDILEEIQITGQFRGKTAYAFNIIGQRNGFTSTSILQGLKEYDNGVADFAVTSNSTLDIKSSSASDSAAGTGCRTVKVTYINNSNNLVESASIALNGLTNVVGVLTGVNQVLWMETETAGSGGVAAGNVILSITGGGAPVEQITAGGNKSRSAIFMIPQGYKGYLKDWRVSAINNDQDCRLRGTVNTLDRSLSTVYHYMSEKYAAAGTSIGPSDLWLKLPALSRIKVSTMSGGTAATVRCSTNFLIILIAD